MFRGLAGVPATTNPRGLALGLDGALWAADGHRGPPEGRQTFTYDQDLLHGHAYTPQPADVHFQRGMACIDCHTEREVHGDGQIFAKRHYEVELENKKLAALRAITAKTELIRRYIVKSMTHEEVRGILGQPRTVSVLGWNCGELWVCFDHGIVTGVGTDHLCSPNLLRKP